MKDDTARRLLAINRSFYQRHAADFARTRRQAWAGWQRLLPLLRGRARLLDVGCGNGRFGRFWAGANPPARRSTTTPSMPACPSSAKPNKRCAPSLA